MSSRKGMKTTYLADESKDLSVGNELEHKVCEHHAVSDRASKKIDR